ncbi:hypothetical protein FPV32_02630 [Bacillus tequilensis]|nr:hypothetical protein [Bacillus tequilensis]
MTIFSSILQHIRLSVQMICCIFYFLDKKRTRITGESVPKKCIHYKKGVNYFINHTLYALHNCYSGIKTQ